MLLKGPIERSIYCFGCRMHWVVSILVAISHALESKLSKEIFPAKVRAKTRSRRIRLSRSLVHT